MLWYRKQSRCLQPQHSTRALAAAPCLTQLPANASGTAEDGLLHLGENQKTEDLGLFFSLSVNVYQVTFKP